MRSCDVLLQILSVFLLFRVPVNCEIESLFEPPPPENFLLCRACGNDIGITKQLISSRISPFAKSAVNESLFDRPQVLVQELVNPHGIRFQVVLLEQAECVARSSDRWTGDESSWFEGYAWKPCHCPKCGAHLGWMFEPIESKSDNLLSPTKQGFYVITVTSVVDEHFVDSLLMREKIFRGP